MAPSQSQSQSSNLLSQSPRPGIWFVSTWNSRHGPQTRRHGQPRRYHTDDCAINAAATLRWGARQLHPAAAKRQWWWWIGNCRLACAKLLCFGASCRLLSIGTCGAATATSGSSCHGHLRCCDVGGQCSWCTVGSSISWQTKQWQWAARAKSCQWYSSGGSSSISQQ